MSTFPIQDQILDANSSLYKTSLRTVFNLLPRDRFRIPVERWWSDEYPAEWKEALKAALLEDKNIRHIQERDLTEEVLDKSISNLLSILKIQIKRASIKERQALLKKEPLDVPSLIKANLERNPLIKPADLQVSLHSLTILFNEESISPLEVFTRAKFLQEISIVSSSREGLTSILINPRNQIVFFLVQFSFLFFSKEDVPAFIMETSEYICDQEIYTRLRDNPESLLNSDNPLSWFYTQLTHLFDTFGDEVVILLKKLPIIIMGFQFQTKEKRERLIGLSIEAGETLFGIPTLPMDFSFSQTIYAFLNRQPLLRPHQDVISAIEERYFSNSEVGKQAATFLYKKWWFEERGTKILISCVDRMLDWLTHEHLVANNHWEQSRDETVEHIERSFRELYPTLPFNRPRVENMYFILTHSQD